MEQAILKYTEFLKFAEGKKPIRTELFILLLDEFLSFKNQYLTIPQIIETFNTEYSKTIKDQINTYSDKTKELDNKIDLLNTKIEAISAFENRVASLDKRESAINELTGQSKDVLDKANKIQDSSVMINEITDKLDEFIYKLANSDQLFDKAQSDLMQKIEHYEKLKLIVDEKEKELIKRESEIESEKILLKTKHEELQNLQDLFIQQQGLLNERMQDLQSLHQKIVENENKSVTIFTEVKSSQKDLNEKIEEFGNLLGQKEYLTQMEEEYKGRKLEMQNSIKQVEIDREFVIQQSNAVTQLFDKSQQSLSENEHTYQLLKGAIENINQYAGNLDGIVSEISQNVAKISKEREDYELLGDRINNQLDEISKQSEGMMKLNVLSTYIHQTIIELKDVEVSLKMISETTNSNLSENKQISNKMSTFLDTSSKLIEQIRNQVDFSVQTEKHLKKMRSELLDTQFQLKESQTELTKYQDKISTKQNQLLELERSLMNKTMELKMKNKDKDN